MTHHPLAEPAQRAQRSVPTKAGELHLRALFALDPNRRAIVLLGGDKRNDWSGWYERNIPIADDLYDEHLRNPHPEDD